MMHPYWGVKKNSGRVQVQPASLTMYPLKPHSPLAISVNNCLLAHAGTPLILKIDGKPRDVTRSNRRRSGDGVGTCCKSTSYSRFRLPHTFEKQAEK